MALPHAFLDDLRTRTSLSDVVGRRVKLIRGAPGEFKGLCPFHNEKTPSFTVSDAKGFFHCFGCGAHGDVIAFEMRAGNLPFMDAIEKLAGEAGLDIPRPDPKEREKVKRRASLREVMEMATRFYAGKLDSPEGTEAQRYLLGRGLSRETIKRFGLGWAPAGNALKAALARESVPPDDMVEAALVTRHEDGAITDYFRDRVIFPIEDAGGRPVGFGGRIMGKGEPKYLNSRDGTLFHKGGLLFNLARAREPARQQGALLVVEGYMDVIALAEHGIEHAVAPLGTAMTEDQLRLAWKAADRVVLCFDGDKAGRKAAERALRRALPLMDSRRRLLICLLPEGQDPDDLVRQAGVDGFHRVADAAQDSVEFAWKLVGEGLATGQASPSDFAAAEALVKELSGLIADQDLRYFFTQDLSRRVKDRFYSLTRGRTGQDPRRSGSMPPGWAPGMATAGGRGRRGQAKPLGEMSSVPVLPVPVNADRVRHLLALSCMVNYPGLYGRIEEDFYRFDFADEDLRDAYAFLDELLMAEGPDGEEDRSLGREAVMDRLAVAYPDVAADLLALDRAGHGGFLAPGQDQRRIYSAWRHLLSMLVVEEMRRDLIAAMDRFGAEQTYESLAHLQTISAMVYASYEVAEEEGAA